MKAAWRLQEYLSLVLPRTCGGCGTDGQLWCSRCAHELGTCVPQLAHADLRVPVTAVLGEYQGVLRRAVISHKQRGIPSLQQVLRGLMLAAFGLLISVLQQLGWWHPPAVLVAIPPSKLHPARVPMLELCQTIGAQELAGAQANTLIRPARPVLRPNRRRKPQKGLDREQRARNIAGAIRLADWPVHAGFTAILVDDVITTGASMNEAAQVLRRHGVLPVAAIAIAHAHSA